MVSSKLRPFGTSIFTTMTALAERHGAINLSQGFPDFEGPASVVEAAVAALRSGRNQYARPRGMPDLVETISERTRERAGLDYDPLEEVVVTSGATEALTATMLGLLEPGDEVIVFEPFYDSFPAAIAMAGASPRFVTLRFPRFEVDLDELRDAFSARTRLLLLNTPHNPTGKVFTRAELEAIAALCIEHGVVVLSDEVYENLTFDDAEHVPIAAVDGMRERTVSVSSAGKTFSFTGWKVGWATGAAPLIAATAAAHQFITFATATPLQLAVADALRTLREGYLATFRSEYAQRRAILVAGLERAGFRVALPSGTYFALADFSALSDEDDVLFARHLTEEAGVAAIPPSSFYHRHPEEGRRLLRFSFAKRLETLHEAMERLAKNTP